MRILGAFVGGTDPRALQVRWMPRALPVRKGEAQAAALYGYEDAHNKYRVTSTVIPAFY